MVNMTARGSMALRTVFKRLTRAHFSIFSAIVVYIGLIVSDPATSPFYAIESALTYVGHNYIVLTMMVVLLIAISVSIGYAAIGMRFNKGEGGTGLVFEWIGAKAAMIAGASLLLDFFLTDAITMAAAVAALVSSGVTLNRFILVFIVFAVVGILIRLGDKGRTVFALMSFLFMGLIIITVLKPVLPNAEQVIAEMTHGSTASIPDHSGLTGIALISLVIFGAVRGFALLTGFEASVAALSHEEEKPKYARIAMGVGTILVVLLFTSFVTYDIASTAANLSMQPDHHHTLFSLWTSAKLGDGLLMNMLSFASIGILLSGAASGATAGGGMIHVLVKSKILPKSFTHIDEEHNDYKAILIVHTIALFITLLFGVQEQKIVAFYAISVLIGFVLSLSAAIKYAIKSKTTYLYAAIPGLLMVILALMINLARMEGLIIMTICLVMGAVLYKRWVDGGKNKIDFSH